MDKLENTADKYFPVVECILKKDSNKENIDKCLSENNPKISPDELKQCEEVCSGYF